MPFYRTNGMNVHMRGTRLPPACAARVGFHSQAGEYSACMAPSAYLCDWPTEGRKTCDMPLCEAHSGQVGSNKNYCPDHLQEHREHRDHRQPGLFTSLVAS